MIKKSNNKGFTLVEVVCAVTIMMLVVVPVFTGFLTAAKTNAKISEHLEINLMLENELELIRTMGVVVTKDENENENKNPPLHTGSQPTAYGLKMNLSSLTIKINCPSAVI